MTDDKNTEYLDAVSALLGLSIRPEDREEVLKAFAVLRGHAQLVAAFPLPEETEMAPRFQP